MPTMCAVRLEIGGIELRVLLLSRFPYKIVFCIEGDFLVVLGVRQHAQDAPNWASRLAVDDK